MDRSAINQALSKAIAYKNCGKDLQSELWTAVLVDLLGHAGILIPSLSDVHEQRLCE